MTEDQTPYEFIAMTPYRIWKLLQPKPPPIYQKDRLTIVPDEPEEESQEE